VTDASEDSQWFMRARRAGANVDWFQDRGSLRYSGLAEKGAGTVNGNGVYCGGHGVAAQTIALSSVAVDSTGTAIPNDTSKPQIGEGKEVFSQAITPLLATSKLEVTVTLQLSHASTGTDLVVAVFDSAVSATDAVAVGGVAAAGTHMTPATVTYVATTGATSARTISVRYGGNTGTTFLNQGSGTAFYGGTLTSSCVIKEILPQ
jgi:hypothetical protein